MLGDAHIHLDALDDESAQRIVDTGAAFLAVGCDPDGFRRAWALLTGQDGALPGSQGSSNEPCLYGKNAHAALGLHPWCVPAPDAPASRQEAFARQLELFEELACNERYIGEVGLDFYASHAQTRDEQLRAFELVCAAAGCGEHVLSLHTRGADREALDCLERYGIVPNSGHTTILHGFNGPSDQMVRALKLGCLFSVGERELKTRRGREYVRQIPLERLLLETDFPRGTIIEVDGDVARHELSTDEWRGSLSRACELLAAIKGLEPKEIVHAINETFRSL